MDLYLPRRAAVVPVMIFTANFREFIRGKPERGAACRISYDPARIVPAEGYDPSVDAWRLETRSVRYLAPETDEPVTAHLRFRADGPVMELPLSTQSGPLRNGTIRLDGRGTMLYGELTVPPDANWMEVWFTYSGLDGGLRFDSRFGQNYLFRFIEQDVEVSEAAVETLTPGIADTFRCSVVTAPEVERVVVRVRVLNDLPEPSSQELDMTRTAPGSDGRTIWRTPAIQVRAGAVVAFSVVYYIGGRHFKEDNQGVDFVVRRGGRRAKK